MARREDIDRLRELEELFADLWQVPRFAAGLRRGHRPQIDVMRSVEPAEVRVTVELAGADPENIRIVLDGRRLLIAGVRPRPRCTGRYHRAEIEYGPFQRELLLADDFDADAAKADYERGILTILLPIAERAPANQRVPIAVRRTA